MLVVKNVEPWAVTYQQRIHAEALQKYGERVIIRHRWNVIDFAEGRVGRCTAEGCSSSLMINENQRIRVLNIEDGYFTLTFGDETTAPILWDQTAEGVRLALASLEAIEEDDVRVTGYRANDIEGLVIEFKGQWAARDDVPLLTADDSNLVPTGQGAVSGVEIKQIQAGSGGANARQRVMEVYKQAGDSWCPSCFGVGFEGGFEPIIYISYALVGDQQAETTRTRSGVIQRADPIIQFSFEPPVEEFDIVARVKTWESDNITPKTVGGRFLLTEVKPTTLRTGPRTADDTISLMPEEYRTRWSMPDNTLIIGQTTQLEVMPINHQYNMVPLTYHEERMAEVGIVEERKWHIKDEAPLNVTPIIKGI